MPNYRVRGVRIDSTVLLRWLAIAAIGVSMVLIDRPLVGALESNVRHSAAWRAIDAAFHTVDTILAALILFGLALSVARRVGWSLPRWADDLRVAAAAAVIALVVVGVLKMIFGRSWPDPTYVQSGVYEFRWFHGEWTPHYGAFPSGAAFISTAIAVSVWQRQSAMRVAAAVIAAMLTVLVVVQEYHWLSDAIAGALLGIVVGSRVAAVSLRRHDLAPQLH